MNDHIKSAHENAFVCEQCNKKFASKQGMTEHIESVHEGIRHKCDFCDYTSSFRNNLNAHIRKKHQNWRKYEQSQEAFILKSYVQTFSERD